MTMTKPFSEVAFNYHFAESEFIDAICNADVDFNFSRTAYDYYDGSIELYDVPPTQRLNEAVQLVIFDAGFKKAYVNHADDWQTHYDFGKEFLMDAGWRRLMRDGHIYVEEFPEGWPKDWLESGYVIIVSNVD